MQTSLFDKSASHPHKESEKSRQNEAKQREGRVHLVKGEIATEKAWKKIVFFFKRIRHRKSRTTG